MLTSYGEHMKHRITPTLAAYFAGDLPSPIGFRATGKPIFGIAGGADDDPPEDPPKNDDPPKFEPISSQADLDRVLGERLARERAKYADYGDLKKKAEAHDEALEAARSDQEKAVEAAKNEGRTEALTTANSRLLSAEARALAAEAKFASPALAVRALDLSDVAVNDDGSVDAEAIKSKLKELADSGAFVIGDGEKPKPKPDKSQGGPTKTTGSKLAGLSGGDLYDRLHPKKTSA